jgi:hypothetical protein
MTQYKADGVTSVFCLCASEGDTLYDGYADNLQYFPEWFTANYLGGQSTTNEFQVWTADQRSSAFGITAVPREVKWQDNPVSWALTEGNPNMDWSTWDSYGNLNAIGGAEEEYRGLLLLASGIQMAGPDLTPQNFAARLQATVFPNPDTPTKEGRVGFGPGGFSMTQDAAEFYFSNTATSTVPQTSGSVCYIDGGARRDLSSWPKGGDPFFPATGNCDSGAYPGQP